MVVAGAEAVANGDLSTRVPVTGNDELAELATTFNRMAAQLQEADARQKELETLRRDLIGWVSHDLRTPLASIQVMIEALADGVVNQPEMVQRYLRTIQGDIRNLSALIDDLFELAQLDAGGLRLRVAHHSLRDLISDTLESMRTVAQQKEVELRADTLVITDDSGAIGMGGIMGGWSTMVSDETRDVFFEAAFFTPEIMAGVARQYGMHTDASMRFERGVDPVGQAHQFVPHVDDLT